MNEKPEKPKITVAVPVYNVKNEYLIKCLDSIIEQTFSDIEILLIENGTNNDNLELISRYESKDRRIRCVFTEKNKGLPWARNQAFENAKGEYITFVDSDDWLDLDILKKAYEESMKNDYPDMTVWTYKVVINDIASNTNYIGPTQKVFEGDEKKKLQLQVFDPTFRNKGLQIPMFVTAWAKMYKMSMIKENLDIRFPEEMISGGEDCPFNYQILGVANRVLLLGEHGYYYRRQENSMTAKMVGNIWDKRCQWMNAVSKVVDYESAVDEMAFQRYCLAQALGQLISEVNIEDNHSDLTDKYRVCVEIRNNEFVAAALVDLGKLEFSIKKKIIFFLFRARMMLGVLLICKLYSKSMRE